MRISQAQLDVAKENLARVDDLNKVLPSDQKREVMKKAAVAVGLFALAYFFHTAIPALVLIGLIAAGVYMAYQAYEQNSLIARTEDTRLTAFAANSDDRVPANKQRPFSDATLVDTASLKRRSAVPTTVASESDDEV